MADFLPLTGWTFPFVSNGGIEYGVRGCWLLIKAAGYRRTRQPAIRLPHGAQELPQEQDAEDDIPDEADAEDEAEDESVLEPWDGRKEAGSRVPRCARAGAGDRARRGDAGVRVKYAVNATNG